MSKQKYLLEVLLSSRDVFARCVSIIKPEYFSGDCRRVSRFALEYFGEYRTTPDFPTILAEYPDVELTVQDITSDKIEYACTQIEKYCKESAVAVAMDESLEDLQNGNLGVIVERMQAAVSVSLRRDVGWEVFSKDFRDRLDEALLSQRTVSTGYKALDTYLSGGLSRKQVTLFTANSGGCKSVMLNNLAYNYAATGHHVVLISLELPREMIFLRSAAITSGVAIKTIGEHTGEVVEIVENLTNNITGSLMIQRLPGDATANDIRSYLTHYEMELGRKPDCLFVDYLDKMSPNQGVGSLGISEQDKAKAFQLAELVHDYDLICASASQQNREAIGNAAPGQNVIAGGITKINEVDNVISLYMDTQMRLRGELAVHFLKTRSADGVGKSSELFWDGTNLRICDPGTNSNNGLFDITTRTANYSRDVIKDMPGLRHGIDTKVMPGLTYDVDETPVKIEPPKANDTLMNYLEELENG